MFSLLQYRASSLIRDAHRHGAYIKEFGKDKVKGRKALIPFLF